MSTLGTGQGLSRTSRPGSSRADFMGLDPSPSSPVPQPDSRRPSQAVSSALQALHDEWNERPKTSIGELDVPHLILSTSSEPTKCIELSGAGERLVVTVVFPWMVASVRCGPHLTLGQMKLELFEGLKKMAVSGFSMVPSDYVFCAVTHPLMEKEDLFDEEQSIGFLMTYLTEPFPFLFLHVPDGLKKEKELASLIGRAIGSPLSDLESRLSDELKQYRVDLYQETDNCLTSRGQVYSHNMNGYSHFAFPEEVQAVAVTDRNVIAPKELISKITNSNLRYQLFFRSLEDEENNEEENIVAVDVDFDLKLTPHSVIDKALKHLAANGTKFESSSASDFLLQIVAQKKFLTGNTRHLIMYAGVRTLLEDYRIPRFIVRRKKIVLRDYPEPMPLYKPSYMRAHESRFGSDETSKGSDDDTTSLWDLDDFFHIRPVSCINLESSEPGRMIYGAFMVIVGNSILAKGRTPLTPVNIPRWVEKTVQFPTLYMKDIPSSSILCVSLVEAVETKKKGREKKRRESLKPVGSEEKEEREREGGRKRSEKNKQEEWQLPDGYDRRPIGWMNVSMFNWKAEFLQGAIHASLWPGMGPGAEESNHFIALDGKLGMSNKKTGSRLVFEFPHRKQRVLPPTDAQFDQFMEQMKKWGMLVPGKTVPYSATDPDYIRLSQILNKHQLGERMSGEEELFVWDMRPSIANHMPHALVLLVDNAVTWSQRETFTDLYRLLGDWDTLDIGAAFTLLDKRFADQRIRDFVVSQIAEKLDNSLFPLYILPLIQALKCEMRASCELAKLLLKRALRDYRIGQKLFWLLRSELANLDHKDDREVANRLTLLLEAYLRGNPEHLKLIVRQVEMVETLTKLSVTVKSYSEKNSATKRLRDDLCEQKASLENIDSPLDPASYLGELQVDRCKVLGSAKMPLRLTWTNMNPLARKYNPVYEIIFKNGDDLRQDMLVLQMLEVMDSIWKREKLDCCLCVYPVLPMGTKIGMIGVVPDCSTIFEIQAESGKLGTAVNALDSTAVNKYLRNNFPVAKEYLECVDRFLMSCVAYSVATYIMGIKDRHNDNIMMTRDGRLFHIDFGHILGHGKTKLGIQRDRTPFVLTEHLVNVIVKGAKGGKEKHDMEKFKQLTVDAYAYLWEYRTLFFSLFSMMMTMKLPELCTKEDLDYLKGALSAQSTDREKAQKFFSQVFEDALNSSWSTKTNWFFHTVKHL